MQWTSNCKFLQNFIFLKFQKYQVIKTTNIKVQNANCKKTSSTNIWVIIGFNMSKNMSFN
jgi:hypothetical protein